MPGDFQDDSPENPGLRKIINFERFGLKIADSAQNCAEIPESSPELTKTFLYFLKLFHSLFFAVKPS